MLVGAALAAAEAHVPSHGALGGSAAAAIAAGIALVVAGAGIGTAVALAAGLVAGVLAAVFALIGRVGEVRATPAPLGQVFLDGALWWARVWNLDEDAALQRGDPIVVERVDGLTLTVRRAEEWEVAP